MAYNNVLGGIELLTVATFAYLLIRRATRKSPASRQELVESPEAEISVTATLERTPNDPGQFGDLAFEDSLAASPEMTAILFRAFPKALKSEVECALRVVPAIYMRDRTAADPGKQKFFPVPAYAAGGFTDLTVDGEEIKIPRRIVVRKPYDPAIAALSEKEQAIVAGIYSLNHDGFVREKYLRYLLSQDYSWVAPFVVPFIGEFVIELVELMLHQVDKLKSQNYKKFVDANPKLLRRIRSQVINYWAYDSGYKEFRDYPGYKVLAQIGWWRGRDGRWLLRHRRSPAKFKIVYQGTTIGSTDLENVDKGMGVASGKFFPTLAYRGVRAVFRQFALATLPQEKGVPADEILLGRYDQDRDNLDLSLTIDGVKIATKTIHIVDYSVEVGKDGLQVDVFFDDRDAFATFFGVNETKSLRPT